MEIAPDTVLRDRYRIIRQLGQGGMGAVYLAFDNTLEHAVAVKLNRNNSPEASTQFLAEAHLLASLRHPNLPRVIDYFIIGESQYLVMDYIPGDDLGTVMQRDGAQPVEKVLQWAQDLGSALVYLHNQNPPVIHRDIKPPNIKLTPEGDVVLVDFGIAKASDVSQATASGATGYTPGYAPPEQYSTARTGPFSDQYALAATLYALLTGQKPVDSVHRLLGQAVLSPLKLLNPAIPDHVVAAIEQAMSVRPDERFTGVADFLIALSDPTVMAKTRSSSSETVYNEKTDGRPSPVTVAGSVVAPPVAPPITGRRTIPIWVWVIAAGVIILGVLVLAVGGAGLLFWQSGRQATSASQTAVALLPIDQPTHTPTPARSLHPTDTLQPSTTSVPPSETPIPTQTSTPTPTNTPFPTETATPASIGGGRLVAFVSNRADGKTFQIWTMTVSRDANGNPLATEYTQLTTDETNKSQPAWSPDGQKLIYVAPGGDKTRGLDLWLLDLNNPGSPALNISNHNFDDTNPAWSQDGQRIAFTGRLSNGYQQLYIMNADGSNLERLSCDFEEYCPTWRGSEAILYVISISGNHFLYMRYQDNQAMPTPRSFQAPTCPTPQAYGQPVPFDALQVFGSLGQVYDPILSFDAQTIAYVRVEGGYFSVDDITKRRTNIYIADWKARGNETSQLTTTNKDRDPAWSIDGKWIVFTSARDGNPEIYVMTNTGLLQTNLTNDPAIDFDPVWQP
jgi:serine/threonine protein kinase/Tol biopolymer transport system component